MPIRLLVSVAGADEVQAALSGGADVIDLKAPAEGALGAPDPAALDAVAAAMRAARRTDRAAAPALSVALGEAVPPPAGPGPGTYALAARAAVLAGAAYVKLGLRGPMTDAEAAGLLAAVVRGARGAHPAARVVAAGFADLGPQGSPAPSRLPAIAAASGAQGVLVDTARKDGRGLLAWATPAALAALAAEARARGLFVGLAGSVRLEDVPALAAARPDLIGVRGAACAGGRRDGRVEAGRVAALRAALDAIVAA